MSYSSAMPAHITNEPWKQAPTPIYLLSGCLIVCFLRFTLTNCLSFVHEVPVS